MSRLSMPWKVFVGAVGVAGTLGFVVAERGADGWPKVHRHAGTWKGLPWIQSISPDELAFSTSLMLLVPVLVAAALLIGPTRRMRKVRVALHRHHRAVVVLCAIGVATLSVLVGHLVLDRTPITDDEQAYLFHARAIALGGLTATSHGAPGYFDNIFLIQHEGRWYSQYPLGHPLVLSLGVVAGNAHVVNPLLAALFTILASLIAREFAGKVAGSATALVSLGSPFLVAVSGTLLSHTTSLSMLTLFLWAGLRATRRHAHLGWAVLAAVAFGAAVIVRPSSAVIVGAPLYGLLAARSWSLADRWRRWIVFFGTGACMAGVQMALNLIVNGHPLLSGYMVYWLPREELRSPFGFGAFPWGIVHTPATAWGNTWHNGLRLAVWTFGWPLSLVVPLLASLGLRRRRTLWLAAAGWFPFLPMAFYFWPGLSDVGPVLFTETLVAWLPLTGIAVAAVGVRHRSTVLAFLFAGVVVVPWAFHRLEAPRLARVASSAAAPITAATAAIPADERALVFCDLFVQPKHQGSWAAGRPNPWPDLRDRVLFVLTASPLVDQAFAQQHFPDRTTYRLREDSELGLEVVPYLDP
jgi:hypothetical protein